MPTWHVKMNMVSPVKIDTRYPYSQNSKCFGFCVRYFLSVSMYQVTLVSLQWGKQILSYVYDITLYKEVEVEFMCPLAGVTHCLLQNVVILSYEQHQQLPM